MVVIEMIWKESRSPYRFARPFEPNARQRRLPRVNRFPRDLAEIPGNVAAADQGNLIKDSLGQGRGNPAKVKIKYYVS